MTEDEDEGDEGTVYLPAGWSVPPPRMPTPAEREAAKHRAARFASIPAEPIDDTDVEEMVTIPRTELERLRAIEGLWHAFAFTGAELERLATETEVLALRLAGFLRKLAERLE
jgi:hypothetical protein